MQRGALRLPDIAPGESASVEIAGLNPEVAPGEEAFLTVYFETATDLGWAPRGFEVGWQQIALPTRRKRRAARRVQLGARAGIDFDTDLGLLSGVTLDGNPLLTTPPLLSLWRAPTDNDGLKLAPNQELKPLGRWRGFGLEQLERVVDRVRTKQTSDGKVMTVRARYTGADPEAAILQNTTYLAENDGAVTITEDIRVPEGLTDLPRVGLAFEVPAALEHLLWLGRGPHESYPDRKRGAAVGRYRSTVTDQYVPYMMPQEHGGHSDTRWFALHDGSGRGIHVGATTPFHFSTSHFTAADLTVATHDVELRARPEVFVHVDIAHRGLGTLSCGPDTLPEYRVGPGRYRFTWTLRPFVDASEANR